MKAGFAKWISVCVGCCLLQGAVQAADALSSSIGVQTEIGRAAVRSQQRVDRLFDKQQQLLQEYKQIRSDLASLKRYDKHLQQMVSAQEEKIVSLERQLEEIDVTHREVIPLLSRMIESLHQFVELDVPFLLAERRARIDRLSGLINRPDLSVAEKYRQVMEAYQIETEYGRTIEAYRGRLESHGLDRLVELLRIGRVALIYRSLDGNEMGVWHQPSHSWKLLPEDYRSALHQGFRIANKQMAPDLLKIPVRAPEVLP